MADAEWKANPPPVRLRRPASGGFCCDRARSQLGREAGIARGQSVAKIDQRGAQFRKLLAVRLPAAGVCSERWQGGVEVVPAGGEVGGGNRRIPGEEDGAHDMCQIGGQVGGVEIEEGVEFIQMGVVCLRVNVPQEGPAGELGADKGIFAAHDIDRALAQQCIVGVRGEEGQGVDVVVAVLPGAVATEM